MMTLHLKLWRDLTHNAGQIAAIALVIACGVMVMIITASSLNALRDSRAQFYLDAHFADIFVDLVRAPRSLLDHLEAIDGVNQIEGRISSMARVTVEGFTDPVQGHFISLENQRLNQVVLLHGQMPQRNDEVVISQPFAQAHQLQAGDVITVVLNGQLERIQVSGIGLSPEFIYQLGPADLLPDYERFGIFWMTRDALASTYELESAFNQLIVTLQPQASAEQVKDALNLALAPYGGRGAYAQDELTSHRFLDEEIAQLQIMAVVLPAIFLGVAAFLLNVLITRLISIQRQPIALLKAFGYHNREIMLHFILFSLVIVTIGVLLGAVAGTLVAGPMGELYARYFRFPQFVFSLQQQSILYAAMIAYAVALAGTWRAVQTIATQAPAESMRPPAPDQFASGWIDSRPWLSQGNRMIARNLLRHRWRSVFSVIGIALSGGLLLLGSYMFSAFDVMLEQHYGQAMQMDLDLTLAEPVNDRELSYLQNLPGIVLSEGYRQVPVRLHHQRHRQTVALIGMQADNTQSLRWLNYRGLLPEHGVVLSSYLATMLDVAVDDVIEVELLSDSQRRFELPVAGVIDEPLGVGAYIERYALNRYIGEGPAINGVWAVLDQQAEAELYQRLHAMPLVIGINQVSKAEEQIRLYIDDTVLVTMIVLLILAGSITVAVVYNNARIIFAERERQLATLRVLGFHQYEVAWLLIGEIALLVCMAIPLGWLSGSGFSWLLLNSLSNDMFRVPWVMSAAPFVFSASGILVATAGSLLLIMRRLQRLDMLASLKTE